MVRLIARVRSSMIGIAGREFSEACLRGKYVISSLIPNGVCFFSRVSLNCLGVLDDVKYCDERFQGNVVAELLRFSYSTNDTG